MVSNINTYFSKYLDDSITDKFIEEILYDKYTIRLIDNINDIFELVSGVTNDYGSLYLKGGIDIKSRLNVPKSKLVGDLDFGCYCEESRFANVDRDSTLICEQLVNSLSTITIYKDKIKKHIAELVNFDEYYHIIDSYNGDDECVKLGNLIDIRLDSSYSNIEMNKVNGSSVLKLIRVYYSIEFSSGVIVKILMYDIAMNTHRVKFDESWIVPRMSLNDLCVEQCYCLVNSIGSNNTKVNKRLSRVKDLLKLAGMTFELIINILEDYIRYHSKFLSLLKPQDAELKYEVGVRSLDQYIIEDIIPIAEDVLSKFKDNALQVTRL